jgi:hypothetical protein
MACRGCKNFLSQWLSFDDAEPHVPSPFPGEQQEQGEAEEQPAAEQQPEVAPTVERRGARLVTHHRHRSECAHSEGNRFITDKQL